MQNILTNKFVLGVATLATVAGSALLVTSALAAEDGTENNCPCERERSEFAEGQHMGPMGEGPRAEVREAVANNDYEAFVELTANAPFAEDISEETFAVMVEAHALMESGDREGARELMSSAGLEGHRLHKGPQFHSEDVE